MNSPDRRGKAQIGGDCIKNTMSNITNFAEKAPNLSFTEYDFYELYRETFEQSELGRFKRLLPLSGGRGCRKTLNDISLVVRSVAGRARTYLSFCLWISYRW